MFPYQKWLNVLSCDLYDIILLFHASRIEQIASTYNQNTPLMAQ